MPSEQDEEALLRSVALQNASSISAARQRAEHDLLTAKEALRESEERLRAVFNQAAVGIAIASLDGKFEQVNRRFTEILGYTAQEVRQMTFLDITHPQDVEQTKSQSQRLLAGEVSEFAYEKRYLRKDGASVWSFASVTLLKDSAGRPRQYVAVIEDISERKSAEEALRRSEQFNRSIIDSTSDCIQILDLAGNLLQMTSRSQQIMGIADIAPYLHKPYVNVWQGSDRDAAAAAVTSAAAGGKGQFVASLATPDGGQSWWDVLITPMIGDDGRPEHLLAVSRDITERRGKEQVGARLAAVVEQSDDAIVTKTLDGIITTWNIGAERMFGYKANEVIGKPITMLMPPDRVNEEQEILRRLRKGERVEHYETVRTRKDGTLLDVSLSVAPLRDSQGRIVGASKIARDITARRQMEEALRDERRILELLNKTGSEIAGQLDLQTLVQSVTDAATQLSGAKFGAFFYNVINQGGESFVLFTLCGATRESFEKFGLPRNTPIFDPTFRGEGVVRSDDITRDARYGTMAPHHGMPPGHLPVRSYIAVPVVSRSGEVIGGLFFGHPNPGVFTDRTERVLVAVAAQAAVAIDNARLYDRVKQAADDREQLLNAERSARAQAERISLLKDEFLATLSHELRTPLTAILGWVQLLRTHPANESDLVEGLTVIERNARAQTQLIEDLLDMSRIISGKIRIDVQQVDLHEVIKAAVASVRHAADAKQIRLQVVLDPIAGPVRGDPSRLQQCFWNLLSNAIKFTPKGGRVQVTLERVNSHVEVCVIDSGEGIRPDFLPHLFERFRQADASTTRRHGGLGLGLSIVKQLVELHGGKVRASSAGEGQGSTFSIELPVVATYESTARDHPRSVNLAATPTDHPSLDGITVLYVDDEPDARYLVKRILESCGATVVLAASSREGLERVQTDRPQMIISDIGMPQEDGYEFIRRVRALPVEDGGRTPAAALTAFARPEDRTFALRAGYQTHVSKPVEPAELTAMVASLASRS